MPIKKPIVLTDGQLEQLQSGDRLDLGNAIERTNNTGGALVIGTPVTVTSTDMVEAQADAQPTIRVAGFVGEPSVADAALGIVLVDGILTATAPQWAAVVVGGVLVPGTDYFLDEATAGMITATAPATGFVVRLGHALSTTEFEIEVQQPIKL